MSYDDVPTGGSDHTQVHRDLAAAVEALEAGGGGGGGAPSGPAGGVLAGTYPDPSFAVDMATQAELDAHAADSTGVHGITDTAALATTSAVTAAIAAHEADTTSVHGIADTAALATLAAIAAGYQPLDADLTAIAALSTTAFGRSLLEAANAAALRTLGGVVNYPWTEIVKSADQTVTNSAVLVDDSELQVACVSGGIYHAEFIVIYSGNDATADYRYDIALPTATGFRRNLAGFGGAGDVIQVSTGVQFSAASNVMGGGVQQGGDASDTPRIIQVELFFRAGAAASLKWQFANWSAASGKTSTTRAGSLLRYRRLA